MPGLGYITTWEQKQAGQSDLSHIRTRLEKKLLLGWGPEEGSCSALTRKIAISSSILTTLGNKELTMYHWVHILNNLFISPNLPGLLSNLIPIFRWGN